MTSRTIIVAVALAALTAGGVGVWATIGRPPAPAATPDPLPAPGPPQVTFARLQTELNRAAAGRPALSVPDGATPEPLEKVGAVLRDLAAGDTDRAARRLDEIDAEIERRLPTPAQITATPPLAKREEWLVSYFELLPDLDPAAPGRPEIRVIERLALALHRIDALLLVDLLPTLDGYDLVSRHAEPEPSPFDGLALRLPCRLAASQRAGIEAAARLLGPLAGPLTDCPVPAGHEADFDLLDRLARDPGRFVAEGGPGPIAAPDVLSTPLMRAAAGGDAAEIRAALTPGADPQRADGFGRTALWHLLGNSRLAPAEKVELARRLF